MISSHGCGWCSATIKQIIKNLTYVQADSILYDYLMKKGFEVLNPKTDFIGVNAGIEVRRCNKETAKKIFCR